MRRRCCSRVAREEEGRLEAEGELIKRLEAQESTSS
uniref:Uncharacterized protein n=1 Tax=Arundo donax TaxID=35708 RepID=A0A0A8ZGZ8_ARUDO